MNRYDQTIPPRLTYPATICIAGLEGRLWRCGIPTTRGVTCGKWGWCPHRDWDECMAHLEASWRREHGEPWPQRRIA